MAEAKADPDAGVVVLTGAGERAFCAGADLTGMADGAGTLEVHDARGELAALFLDLWDLGKPTIARVRGFALAGGMGLALACDLVVASDDAVVRHARDRRRAVAVHDHRAAAAGRCRRRRRSS